MDYISQINQESVGTEIVLKGWITHLRSSGKISFIELRDGSGFIQLIVEKDKIGENKFNELNSCGIETAISAKGTVSKHPKKDEYELQVTDVEIITKTNDYPLGQKEHGVEFLLEKRHLWLRSEKQWAIQRVRNTIIWATYEWFKNNGFIKIDSPIFTPSACEGTTELFAVKYVNDETVYLSQSGQLYLEAAIMAHGKVFDFGPVFRAEKSKTRRHLNEFWMMDAEMAFVDNKGNMEIQEQLIYHILQEVLKTNKKELQILERPIENLEKIKLPFPRVKHKDRVAELINMGFDVKQGDDIGSDIEMQYCEKIDQPFFLTHFPMGIKAFYTKEDPENPGYALCSDLLAPEGCGEVIGGAQRIDDVETLEQKIKEHNLPKEYFDWYLDVRKYGGVPHSGFGYGLERLVRWLCGLHHIRETIPFPRTINIIKP